MSKYGPELRQLDLLSRNVDRSFDNRTYFPEIWIGVSAIGLTLTKCGSEFR
jgi:hypothetical protein